MKMPMFEDYEVSVKVDIDFEVFCKTCGAGLCGLSDTRRSRNRGYLQVEVEACPDCLKEKDKQIDELMSQNAEYEDRIAELEAKIKDNELFEGQDVKD